MAEAAVEERPMQRFYCHMCNVRFEAASPNFTCPHCSDGFVEELLEQPDASDDNYDGHDWEDEGIEIRDLFMSALPSLHDRQGGRSRSLDGNHSRRAYPRNSRARIVRPRTLTRIASSNLRQNIPFENLIEDVIINLGVGVNWGNTANMQLFLGNPGDYAWGREGLDAIVTQLLNQMDCTGPPPVSKDVIDALPEVEITSEQVEKKLQCSVCWEDFLTNEKVRQLPCQHVYHEPCIRPWLELHGTCPICRQNLVENDQQNNGEQQGNEATATRFSFFGNLNDGSSSSSSSSDSTVDRSYNSDSAM